MFKDLVYILDVLYSCILGFVIFRVVDKWSDIGSWASLCLIFFSVSLLEDYITVRMFNFLKPYTGTTRFAIDVSIALLFFITVYLISEKRVNFIFPAVYISHMSSFWVLMLQCDKELDEKCRNYLDLSLDYSSSLSFMYTIFLILCVFLPTVIFVFNIAVYASIAIYMIALIRLVYKKIMIIINYENDDNINAFVRHTAPFLSKWIVFLIIYWIAPELRDSIKNDIMN